MRPTDEELVARHLRGDPEAFAELVERYTGRLFHLIFRFTADRSQAEDLTQETFLHAFRALPRSQTDRLFRPWLIQIAVNLCRDWARRQKHTPLLFADLDDGSDTTLVDEIADEAPSALDDLETMERVEMIRRVLLDLPEADRLLITLRYDEGLSYAQIGELFGMPAATVGTHLFRAKHRLQAALSGLREGAG